MTAKLLIVVLLSCNFIISAQQVIRMKNGKATSFPQLVMPDKVTSITNYVYKNPSNYGLFLPTAEEAGWVAINLPKKADNLYLSLGAQNQALAEIEKSSCETDKQRETLSKIQTVIFNRKVIDITPTPILNDYSRNPELPHDDWIIEQIENFDSLLAVYSGMFPPTLNSQISVNPILQSTSLRWSSGRSCLAFYSNIKGVISIRFPILIGPDAGNNPQIVSSSALNLSVDIISSTQRVLYLEQKVMEGWNFIDVSMPQSARKNRERFFQVRADGRELRFAIGTTRYTISGN